MNLGIYIYIASKIVLGILPLGYFIQYTGAIQSFASSISNLCNVIARLYTNNQYLEETYKYFDLAKQNRIEAIGKIIFNGNNDVIEFEGDLH